MTNNFEDKKGCFIVIYLYLKKAYVCNVIIRKIGSFAIIMDAK